MPKVAASERKYLDNEDSLATIQQDANTAFESYKTQREDYEELWEVCDYMLKAGANRTINTEEEGKGMVLPDDSERAQTGSTLFVKQISQLSSQGAALQTSRELPFRYRPVSNDAIFDSYQDANQMRKQWESLAKWTVKQDGFDNKSISFWHQLYKYGNIPVMISQLRERAMVNVRENTYEEQPDGSVKVTGSKDSTKELITKNYPSLTVMSVDALYADLKIGNIQNQNTVVVLSFKNASDLWAGVQEGFYDAEVVQEIIDAGDKYIWDGTTNKDLSKTRNENNGSTTEPSKATDQYMCFDTFDRLSLEDNGDINEREIAPEWYLHTVIGNDIRNGKCVAFGKNEDPDGEVPIEMIHCYPDDEDFLYHRSAGQIVRSNYSCECTLKNLALDNMSLVNEPPLKELEGMVRGTDRNYKPGQVFRMDDLAALVEMDVHDNTANTLALLQYMQEDTKQALSTEDSVMGQALGSRTSALEANNVFRSAATPHIINAKYIMNQYIGFYARKIMSYWEKYAEVGQIAAITDEEQIVRVYPKDLYGNFDVEVDVVDEAENDIVQENQILETMRLAGELPEVGKYIDIHELVTEWFKRRKMDYAKLVKRPNDADAEHMATQENIKMVNNGTPAQIVPGENLNTHLSVHKGERIRYNGLEDQYPGIALLDQHIIETEAAIEQGDARPASPTGLSDDSGGSAAGGGEIAGALGGALGG